MTGHSPRTNMNNENLFWFRLLMVLAAMGVVTAKLMDAHPLRSANDRSRWATVWSLGERGTYKIDEIRKRPGWDTIDLVRHEGHFYSTKPPLLPRMVSELYRWIRWGTGWTLTDNTEAVTRLILLLINVVPFGLALWVLSGLICRYCEDAFGKLFLVTAACWGTLLLPFLTVFNNHTIAASCFIFSLWLMLSIVAEGKQDWWRYALCGLFAAFGVCNELPAAVFGLALFAILLRHSPQRTLACFVPAALVPLTGFFLTNYHATGGWKPFYLYYGTEKYEFVHQGIPSYWADPKGIDKAQDSPLTYLLHCTIGHHGIFSLTPIYLFVLLGWLMPGEWWRSKLRGVCLLSLTLTLVVLGFYLLKTENYNYGGVSVALRWTLWLAPFWLLTMIPAFNRLGHSSPFRVVSLLLLSLSIFSAWHPKDAPWTQPWLFRLMEKGEWIDYSDPRPQFDRRHYTWISRLPEGARQEDYRVTFESVDTAGGTDALLLEDGGIGAEGVSGSSPARILNVTWRRHGMESERKSFLLDPRGFHAGAPVETFLLDTGEFPIAEEDHMFFWGVPQPRPYFSSRIRYVRTSLREDAFRCHVGYTHASVKDESGRMLQYIRDVWFCEEVPFGVLQWEDRVLDPRTKEILARRFWKATEAGFPGGAADR